MDELIATLPFSYFSAAIAFSLVLGELLLLAARLRVLFPSGCRPCLWKTFATFFRGQLINNFTVAGAGDLYKVKGLSSVCENRALTTPHRVGIVLLDKILEGGTLILLCAVGCRKGLAIGQILQTPWTRRLAFATVLVLGVLGIRAILRRNLVDELVRLKNTVASNITLTAIIFGLTASVVAWSFELAAILLLCSKYGIGISQGMLILASLNLGSLVPAPIGKIGVYEGAMVLGMSQVGIPVVPALKIATTLHLFLLAGITLGALFTAGLIARSTTLKISKG